MIYQFSAIGERHLRTGAENQDAVFAFENDRYALLVLSDGVSVCPRAGQGAQLACSTAAELIGACPEYFMNTAPGIIARVILRNVLYALDCQARSDGAERADYSSTLSFALLDRQTRRALLFQLGDGLIVGREAGRCSVLVQPGKRLEGVCVTTTENAQTACTVRFVEQSDGVTLLTDGAWGSLLAGGAICGDAAQMITEGKFNALEKYISGQRPQDDYSFAAWTA